MHQAAVNRATKMMTGIRWVYFEVCHGAYNAPYPSNEAEFKGCSSSYIDNPSVTLASFNNSSPGK